MRQHTIVVDVPDEIDDHDAETVVKIAIESMEVWSTADRRRGVAFGERHRIRVAEHHRERMLAEAVWVDDHIYIHKHSS